MIDKPSYDTDAKAAPSPDRDAARTAAPARRHIECDGEHDASPTADRGACRDTRTWHRADGADRPG